MLKKLFYRVLVAIYPILMTVLFMFFLMNMNIKLENSYVWILSFAYCFCLYVFFVVYYGNKIGVYRIVEILYSNALSLLITNVIFGLFLVVLLRCIDWGFYFVLMFLVQLLCSVVWTVLCNTIQMKIYGAHSILLISSDKHSAEVLQKKLANRKNRFFIKETIYADLDPKTIIECCEKYETIMIDDLDQNLRNIITNYCFENGKEMFMVPKIEEIIRKGSRTLHIIDTPLYVTKKYPLTIEQGIVKRIVDLVLAGIATIVASPFMLVTALAIKLYDGGPALYKQKRLTKDGKEFYVYKFRSMIVDAEKNSGARLSSGENDDRITKVGKIIRAIRFDELPQLFNILKGDMSIVGPRPERPEIAEQYYEELPEFKYRLKVKAGLTGYAQVFGKYNTTPKDKLKLDLMYINNYSLYLDLKVIFYTVKILFMKESTEGIEEGKTTAA